MEPEASKWFLAFESDIKQMQNAEKRKQAAIPGFLIGLVAIFAVGALISGIDGVTLLYGLGLPCALIVGFIILIFRLGQGPDPIKDLHLNLVRLFDTLDDVHVFDKEMMASSLFEIQATDTLTIHFTEHYIYTTEMIAGVKNIEIAGYHEICTNTCYKEKSWISGNPFNFHFYLDFLDEEKQKILSISIEDDNLEIFKQQLAKYRPDLELIIKY